jgi:ABC-type nitrate/sulfonate/bicarbonate transport system substrate-binding protein
VNDGIVAKRSWVDANRDVMQRFMDSIMQAKPREKADKAATLPLIKKWLKDDDPAKADFSYEYFVNGVIPDAPYPTPANFKDAIDVLAAQNPKAVGFDASKIVDPSFVKSAVDRGIGKS